MTPRLSTYLDLLRVVAALVVLLSHWAYPRFTRGDHLWIRELNLGSDAVVLFFVLSGLVIAWTAGTADRTAGRYAFRRVTRLLSVAAPALLLTLLLDRLGSRLDPEAYRGWWYHPAPAWRVLLQGLSFTSEWGPFGFRPGTNGPYWSLSYEAAYYLLFGIAVFTRGARRLLLLALGALAVGVKVLALAPSWLLGVAVARALREPVRRPRAACWLLVLAPPALYALLLALGLPGLLRGLTAALLGPAALEALRFSDEFLWNAVIGALAAAHLLGVAGLGGTTVPRRAAAAVRWLAGASFSIYLVHYPALQFLDALLPAFGPPGLRDLALLAGVLALCLGFAQLFERPLPAFRAALGRFAALLRGGRPVAEARPHRP